MSGRTRIKGFDTSGRQFGAFYAYLFQAAALQYVCALTQIRHATRKTLVIGAKLNEFINIAMIR
jgi:hypothetical protein